MKRAWSPMWCNAIKGVQSFPDHYLLLGPVVMEQKADDIFERLQRQIFASTDLRYQHLKRMLTKYGKFVSGAQNFFELERPLISNCLVVCDGQYFFLNGYHSIRLGNIDEMRENFPGWL